MRKQIRIGAVLWALLLLNTAAAQTAKEAPKPQRPIEIADILNWKRIQTPTASADGQWFAYRLAAAEGDNEVILRRTTDNKELKFPAGEAQGFAAASSLVFSDDSKWLAFTTNPTAKEAKRARKERKPIYSKVWLINLATEKRVEFDKVKRFAFSGEQAGWLALHRQGTDAPAPSGPPAPGAPAVERPSGSDLILYELASGSQLNLGNVAEFAFDKKGLWLAFIIDAQEKIGNGVQLRNMTSGALLPLESDKASYRSLNWNERGDAFALLKGVEDKKYEDKLYSVVGFTGLAASPPQKTIYNPRDDKNFPADMNISLNRTPEWTEDLSAILFGITALKKKEGAEKAEDDKAKAEDPKASAMAAMKKGEEEDKPDMVIWHYKDKRLQAQQQVEEGRDKVFSYLSIYRVAEKRFIRLADETVRQVTAAPKQQWAIGLDNSEYELMSNLEGKRFQDIYAIDLKTGGRKLAVKKSRNYFGASPDGSHFLYYDDGHFFTYDLASGQSYNITQGVPAVFYNTEDDHNVVKPAQSPVGWTKHGASVMLSDGWDVWNVNVHGGQASNLTVNGKKEGIRYRQRYNLDPEEKGIDLSKPVYLGSYGEWTKKAGLVRIDNGKPGANVLLWDDAAFGPLIKARKADKYFYTRETPEAYPDFYVADASLKGGVRLTEANPQQKEFLWSKGARLINYTSAKGDKLQGALFLPANYEEGKSYPTIVYIYEKLSQGLNAYAQPTANGFNKSVYTSQGYAVLMPDIVYKINDPGMSAVWCVLPALEAAIKTGVVDKSRVGIQGHSWGGYQTSFLITQTDAFKAAVAGAPLTNMIDMYSLIYWNTGSANQPIFESSQGRFTTGYWDNIEAYTRNSPVYFAKNVKTPLIILHNDKDGAVDWTQGIQYFNTLRRLQKPVVMLQYKGENHGLVKPENRKDYTVRMKEFFDYYLKDKPAPRWLVEGVPHLKLKEHLDERAKEAKERPDFDNQ
jgi:dipeptidyl aminopeptidase/acylaminoacyl peptidase